RSVWLRRSGAAALAHLAGLRVHQSSVAARRRRRHLEQLAPRLLRRRHAALQRRRPEDHLAVRQDSVTARLLVQPPGMPWPGPTIFGQAASALQPGCTWGG